MVEIKNSATAALPKHRIGENVFLNIRHSGSKNIRVSNPAYVAKYIAVPKMKANIETESMLGAWENILMKMASAAKITNVAKWKLRLIASISRNVKRNIAPLAAYSRISRVFLFTIEPNCFYIILDTEQGCASV